MGIANLMWTLNKQDRNTCIGTEKKPACRLNEWANEMAKMKLWGQQKYLALYQYWPQRGNEEKNQTDLYYGIELIFTSLFKLASTEFEKIYQFNALLSNYSMLLFILLWNDILIVQSKQ